MRTHFTGRAIQVVISSLLLAVGGSCMVTGQVSGVEVGFGGGVVVGQGIGGITVYPGSAECGEFLSPTVTGVQMDGIFVERNLFGDRSGLVSRLGYRDLTWDAATPAIDPLVVENTSTGEILRIGRDYHFVLKERRIDASLAWRGGLPGSFGLIAGVGIGYRLNRSVVRTERIQDGSEFRFDSGLVERPLAGLEALDLVALGGTLQFGIDRYVELKGIALLPFVQAVYDPLGPEAQRRLSSITVTIGAALLFPTSRLPATPAPPPPPPLAVIDTGRSASPPNVVDAKPTHLTASVEVYGLDREDRRLPAATVTIYETITRVRGSLPRRIAFVGGEPETGGVTTPQETRSFNPDSLATFSVDDLNRQVLPLVGDLMRRTDGSRIRLTGRYRVRDGEHDAAGRVRRVADYLIGVWQIAEERIEAVTMRSPRGSDDVGIEFIPESVGERVDLEHHTRTIVPPLLAVDREYTSDAGIKRWKIEIFHGDRRVGLFSSEGDQSDDSALSWDIPAGEAALRRSSLIAELTVEDSAGTTAKTRAPTPLIIDRPCRVVHVALGNAPQAPTTVCSLFPFEDGSADVVGENRSAIEEFVASLKTGASVRVLLDSERGMGKRLTAERGKRVREALLEAMKRRGLRNGRVLVVDVERNINPIDRDLPEGTRGSFEILLLGES